MPIYFYIHTSWSFADLWLHVLNINVGLYSSILYLYYNEELYVLFLFMLILGEDPMLSDPQQYRYMTVDDMKSLGDDSVKIDVTRDESDHHRDSFRKYIYYY